MEEIQFETKKNKNKNKLFLLTVTLVLVGGLIAGVRMVQVRQENRSKAAFDIAVCSSTSCNTCTDESECKIFDCRWLFNGFSHFCTR